jgi:uncharacterized membrane protein YdbT with pleckstrin-like domain
MGKYVDENIGTGEAVRYTGRISLWKFSLYFLVGGVLIAASIAAFIVKPTTPSTGSELATGATYAIGLLLLLAVLLFIWPYIARWSTELVITDKRLIAKYGVVSTHSIEIRFDKIETVRVTQGLVGKVLKYGDIVVTGTGSTFDPIRSIANPMAFRAALNQAMELNAPVGGRRPEANLNVNKIIAE